MTDLSEDVAYRSMFYFLQDYYQLTESDEIGGLLGGMALLEDGGPADAAVAEDWQKAVERARHDLETVKFRLIDEQS